MKRSGFSTKPPPRAANAREGEFVGFKPRPRDHAVPGLVTSLADIFGMVARPVVPKTPCRKSTAIRESARGEAYLVRIPGVCRGGTEHTIWSHAPLGAAGKGRGIKAPDVCGAVCCTACDACVDGQTKRPEGMTREQVLLAWHEGHMRSMVYLKQKGLL